MMHGRKKQLLNSFKADDFGGFLQTAGSAQPPPGQTTNSSTPPSHGNSGGDSLNLNQPLTDQLTQRGRLHPTGNHAPPRGGGGGVSGGGGRTEGSSNHIQLPTRTLQQSMCPSELDHRGPPSRGRSPTSVQQLSLGSSSSSSSLSSMSCRTGSSSGRRTQANSGTDTNASGGGLQKPLPPRSQQQQQQMSRNQSPGSVLSMRDSSGHPGSLVAPGPPPAFQAGDLDPATLSRLAAFQQAQVAAMRFPLPAPTLLSPFLLQPDSVVTRHLEQLWQAKFPQRPMPPPWMLHQFQEDLLRDNVVSRLTAASDSSREQIRDHRTDRDRERDRERDQRNEHDSRAGSRIIDLENEDRHLEREPSMNGKRPLPADRVTLLPDRRTGPSAWDPPGSQHVPMSTNSVPGVSAADRRTERSMIVEQTAACVADAVQQHFNESLLRLQATAAAAAHKPFVSSPSGTAAVSCTSVLPTPWNPALLSVHSSSSPVGSSNSAFAPPSASFKKSPVAVEQQRKISAQDQHAMSISQQAAALMSATGSFNRMHDDRIKMEEKLTENKFRMEERSKFDSRIKPEEISKYEESSKYEEYSNSREMKYKCEDRNRFEEKLKSEERIKSEERGMWNEDRLRCERIKFEEQTFKNEREEMIQMRPRPAHTGSAIDGMYVSGSSKSRGNQMMNNSSARMGAPPSGQSELNFNLYGYQPYQPTYISNDKLNHAMTATNGGDPRADKTSSANAGSRMMGSLADDMNNAKQTSVIVERRNLPPTLDGYRNRGSITQGTPGDPSSFRSALNWFDGNSRSEQITPEERAWVAKHAKRLATSNGLSWQQPNNSQSSVSTVSPPSKSDLVQQGLVSNPLYSSTSSTCGPVRTSDDQSKRHFVSAVSRDPIGQAKNTSLPTSNLPTSNTMTGMQSFQASYIDSFKSFVDRAVQSAFMEDTPAEHLNQHSIAVSGIIGDGNAMMEPLRPIVSSVLQTLSGSPAGGLALTGQSGASLPVSCRPNNDVETLSAVDKIITSRNSGSGVSSPFSVAALTKSSSPGSVGRCSAPLPPLNNRKSESPMLASTTGCIAGASTSSVMPSLTSLGTRSAPALVSSISANSPAPQFNADPPLLMPQQPISFPSSESSSVTGTAISTSLAVDRQSANVAVTASSASGDTDSDTLSAHSPAPLLVPMTSTPPPSLAVTASGPNNWHPKFKKSWLMRYSDEDRKNESPNGIITQPGLVPQTLKRENGEDKSGELNEVVEKQKDVKHAKVKRCEVSKAESLPECSAEKKHCASKQCSKSDSEETGHHHSEDSKDSDGKGTVEKDTVKHCYIKCSDILNKENDCKSPRRGGKDSKEDKEESSPVAAESSDSQSTGAQSRKRKSVRKSSSKATSDTSPAKKQKTSLSRDNVDADSTHSTSNHSTASEEPPPKSTNSKPNATSKVSKASSAPLSDCELKMAARLKELKGKVRSGTLSSVLEKKPLNRVTSEARRKKTREPYVQDGACYDITPKLMKCRECKLSNGQRNNSQLANNIFCRFYAFRKLCYSAKGLVAVSGFCKPSDADADDIELWLPVAVSDRRFTVDKAKYTIAILSDSFVKLLEEEKEAADLGKAHASKVVWKRAIQGVREMCDSCDATLFNVHWTCAKCGFAVCVDCYRTSHSSANTAPSEWLTCSANKQPHDVSALMMTQIIPSDILLVVHRMLIDMISKWHIRSVGGKVTENGGIGFNQVLPIINGVRPNSSKTAKSRKKRVAKEDTDSTCSSNASSSEHRVKENGNSSTDARNGFDMELNDYHSDDSLETSRCSTSKLLDSGRLLRVTVSVLNGDDLTAFRQHWQKALPVLVSRPDVWYRADIWRPSALARCPGSPAVDVKAGSDIPASQYWDQFERLGKHPVVTSSSVCSKDWPSPDDLLAFSTHLRDLDAGLPFPEYTRFGGALHSMSHLPEYFVRPELSTLRILGHGSSVNGLVTACSKLRMDSADTVNTAVFVSGEPEDYDLQASSIASSLGDTTQVAGLIHSCAKNASKPVSAVWHVFRPQDGDVIRDFMAKVAGTGQQDALSETNTYLDASLRSRLANDHSIHCSTVVQCLGDTIFIPAMAPYQVCAVQNCIIASREFLSPESLRYCHDAGNSRRNRNSKNGSAINFEDQLQGKNLIYHTVKDAIAVLQSADP